MGGGHRQSRPRPARTLWEAQAVEAAPGGQDARAPIPRPPLSDRQIDALLAACREVADGKFDDQFPVDVFQTGSGTSSNMNANEVIANRAIELSGGDRFHAEKPIHPNDHVNLGQSTNDVFPTAIHVAAAVAIRTRLLPALERCGKTLADKAAQWKDVLKIGRTHLADATPLALGQEIGGLARQLVCSTGRASMAMKALFELPIGGTAVGTGINTHPEFGRRVCELLARETGIPFAEAVDHFEANAQRDGLVECHGQLRTIATTLFNVANNIRWLASGPRCGFYEIKLPDRQPGSSIMPGKVNPVLCESRDAGRRPGAGQRPDDHPLRRRRRAVPTQRDDAGDGRCALGKRAAAGRRDQRLDRPVPEGHGGQPGSVRGGRGKEPRDGYGLDSLHRLRSGGRAGERGVCHGQDDPRALPPEEHTFRGATRRGPRSLADDPAATVAPLSLWERGWG